MPARTFSLAIALMLSCASTMLGQNLLLNDSFESVTPPIPPDSFRHLVSTNVDDVDNWITDGGGAGIYAFNNSGGPRGGGSTLTVGPASPGGSNAIFFNADMGSDSFIQNVSLTSGTIYEFGFDIAENFFFGDSHGRMIFDLLVNGTVVGSFSTLTLTPAWTNLSTTFLYTGPSASVPVALRATVVGPTDQDYYTDRYYLVAVVPEPSSSMLLLGGSAIAFAGWRIHRRPRRAVR